MQKTQKSHQTRRSAYQLRREQQATLLSLPLPSRAGGGEEYKEGVGGFLRDVGHHQSHKDGAEPCRVGPLREGRAALMLPLGPLHTSLPPF